MLKYTSEIYVPSSKRGAGDARVICCVLDDPMDVLCKINNKVLDALQKEKLSSCSGLYFYRFADKSKPFIKIGETARPGGIAKRFSAGWFGKGTDTYTTKIKNKAKIESDFLKSIKSVGPQNLIYFVFYQHPLIWSHTKSDEMYSMVMHQRLYKTGTVNGERANKNRLLGRQLVFHKPAFSEVLAAKLPSGKSYI